MSGLKAQDDPVRVAHLRKPCCIIDLEIAQRGFERSADR
jgi:hypothetical protein